VAAFLLTIVIFAFWSISGYALIWGLYTRRNLMQSALLAPAVGAATTALTVTTLNSAGAPVRYGGPAATVLLVCLCGFMLWRYRPIVPMRRLLPFAIVLVTAAVVTGYPMFRYGFNWVSYGNDDMANYSLGAKLFLDHGAFAIPAAGDIINDRDASLFYWVFLIVGAMRHGAEETLAWALSMTGLSSHQAFMPVILAFHLVLIAAAGALVLQSRRFRSAALLVCLAMAFSALTTLGALYQLYGQVTGLGAFTATCAVLLRPLGSRKSTAALAGILTAGTALFYPEVVPFLALSFVAYHGLAIARGQTTLRDIGQCLWPTIIFSIIFLNVSVFAAGVTLIGQSRAIAPRPGSVDVLFPYYLMPSGLAYIWGFHAIGQAAVGRLLDVGIISGGILLIFVFIASLSQAWRAYPAAIVYLVMSVVGIQLFRVQNDFGTYKIAMYIQPFLLSVSAVAWLNLHKCLSRFVLGKSVSVCLLAIILGWGASAQLFYTQRSMGEGGEAGLIELPYASSEGLIEQLMALPSESRAYLSDTSNVVLAKFESLYQPVFFVAKDFLAGYVSPPATKYDPFDRIYRDDVQNFGKQRAAHFKSALFDMHGALPSSNRFQFRRESLDAELPFIEIGTRTSVLNRRNKPVGRGLARQREKTNYLMFVASEFGNSSYLLGEERADRPAGRVAMYQIEPDYFFRDRSMVSLGRDSLFRVLNSTRPLRMAVEYTASLNGDHDNRIPAASTIGDQRHMFSVEGRGSARLFSSPLAPQEIEGGEYVALDMGSWGWTFPDRRSRIMRLYGNDLMSDTRKIVGFARDISLVSVAEYASLNAPTAIQSFPNDLGNKNLEYCGIYEDGWIAESSYAVLSRPERSPSLVVSLWIPVLKGRPASNWAALLLDGSEVGRQSTSSGSVSFRIGVQAPGRHRVELRFDRAENLPQPDNRPVSAQVRYMGFQPNRSETVQDKH
jgi:hypothetical protein